MIEIGHSDVALLDIKSGTPDQTLHEFLEWKSNYLV